MDGIQPAQLSFLTIYNPLLGQTEETSHDQILYYYSSRHGRARKERQARGLGAEELQNEERNEQMRQVGLAQAMVNLAKDFSDGVAVDYVDTEKSRVLLHELEPEWWILASIDLTQIEVALPHDKSRSKSKSTADQQQKKIEYSSRELCPQPLLLQHVLRAHGIFLLHHGASLSEVFSRRGRQALTTALERYWNRFVRYWDVLLHGSPATEIFSGLKLAAGGELGIGVGEEEWGSAERAVLEDLVHETDGLVDMIVSRFGNAASEKALRYEEQPEPWMGVGAYPAASDGIIFAGVGAVARLDVARISAWMETLYRFGLAAYGVQDNPQSARPKRRRGERPSGPSRTETAESDVAASLPITPSIRGIPPPILRPLGQAAANTTATKKDKTANEAQDNKTGKGEGQSYVDGETLMKYMTLGIYGSSWGIPSGRPAPARTPSNASKTKTDSQQAHEDEEDQQGPLENVEPLSLEEQARRQARRHPDVTRGCFIIGLKGDLEAIPPDDEEFNTDGERMEEPVISDAASGQSARPADPASRIQLRTVYMNQGSGVDLSSPRLRIVVYARQPFVYTFLFDGKTQSGLSMQSFYRRLHNQLSPIHRSLLRSTAPSGVRRRLKAAAADAGAEGVVTHRTAPVYDVMYDHERGTCHSSLPAVPDFGESLGLTVRPKTAAGASDASGGGGAGGSAGQESPPPPPWSRADAVHVHSLITRIWHDTRRRPREMQRTVCSSRGWWVVWMRLPSVSETESSAEDARGEEREEGGEQEEQVEVEGRDEENSLVVEQARGDAPASSAASTKDTASIADLQNSEVGSSFATSTAASEDGDRGVPVLGEEDPADTGSMLLTGRHLETSTVARRPINLLREAFLVRRAQESTGRGGKGILSGFTAGTKRQDDGSGGGGSVKLIEGMGIDPRRYIESLLSLNR